MDKFRFIVCVCGIGMYEHRFSVCVWDELY